MILTKEQLIEKLQKVPDGTIIKVWDRETDVPTFNLYVSYDAEEGEVWITDSEWFNNTL